VLYFRRDGLLFGGAEGVLFIEEQAVGGRRHVAVLLLERAHGGLPLLRASITGGYGVVGVGYLHTGSSSKLCTGYKLL